MKKDTLKRGLCSLLCAAMLVQPMTAAALREVPYSIEDAAESSAVLELHNGTAVIPAETALEDVKQILAEALIGPGVDGSGLEWEYYCEGKSGLLKNSAWVSIENGTSSTKKLGITTTYTHPSLADNSDGDYQIRLAGMTEEVTLTKLSKEPLEPASITLNDNVSVAIPYDEDGNIDFDALRESIFNAAVASTTPEMGIADVTIAYYATAKTGVVKKWMPLNGGKENLLDYPAISEGTHQIKFTYGGGDGYTDASAETSVTLTARSEAPYVLRDPIDSVKLPINEDLSVNYEPLKGMLFSAVVEQSDVLTADNVTIEYYAAAKTGLIKKWMPLSGGKDSMLDYPGISAGIQQIRISWPGSQTYAPTAIEVSVEILDRKALQVALNDAPYEVGMIFNAEQGYDYEATAQAIYNAVVASTAPAVSYEEAAIEYTTTADLLGVNYQPLNHQGTTGLLNFKDGTWKVRITWGDTIDYLGTSVTVEVTTSDRRIASVVALREGVSFTYNMDPAVMEQAIFDNVIDWENSTLPEGLDISYFEIQYKAQMDVLDDTVDADKLGSLVGAIPGMGDVGGSIGDIAGSLGDTTKRFMPIAGGSYLGIPYAPMGAGEQQIQVSFKGSAEYRPSDAAEAAVTVNKANVKVKVHSDNIRVGESLPANFITTDPADKFEFYTLYTGATSDISLGIYLDLPDKYDNNKIMKLIDPVVEKIAGKSFSQMLQDGVTLGELRQLFSNTELLDLLSKVGVDTGAFGQILKVVNALPSITDGVRISFGTPSRAGLYVVTAITNNKNYNTGVGVGALLVRMHLKGVKLTWNQDLGKTISADEAKEFDFGATLSLDGDVTISQENVHYLYSGLTSKWKVYSSTATPPTEPGRYTVTVVTLGGGYQAAPITRSFQITK